MRTHPRRWTLNSVNRKKGRYWLLRTGRGADRRSVSLGYVTEAEAERCLEQMHIEEEKGTADPLLDWYRQDPQEAMAFLTGDPGVRALLDDGPNFRLMTLQTYFDDFYKEEREAEIPRSWRTENGNWSRILAVLGRRRLHDIDAHVVADYLDDLKVSRGARRGQTASGNTKRLHRAAVQALLNFAYRRKHIPHLPELSIFRIKGSTRRVVEKPEPFTLDELLALMKHSEPKYRAMWAVGAGQGLRPAELARIHWEDLDFQDRTLAVRGTKTAGSSATIPLTPLALRELQRWHRASGSPSEGLCFPSPVGGEYAAQGWRRPLRQAADRAGITRRVYPYLLRDSFATIAWSCGIPLDLARRVMRHTKNSRLLEEVYCRPTPAQIAEKLAAFDVATVPDAPEGAEDR